MNNKWYWVLLFSLLAVAGLGAWLADNPWVAVCPFLGSWAHLAHNTFKQ